MGRARKLQHYHGNLWGFCLPTDQAYKQHIQRFTFPLVKQLLYARIIAFSIDQCSAFPTLNNFNTYSDTIFIKCTSPHHNSIKRDQVLFFQLVALIQDTLLFEDRIVAFKSLEIITVTRLHI